MRYITLIFLLLLSQSSAFCQHDQLIDSLTTLLKKLPQQDIKRVPALLKVSAHYLNSSPEQSLVYAQEAYSIASKTIQDTLKINTIMALGIAHEYMTRYDSAMKLYRQALVKSEVISYQSGIVKAYGNIAICHEMISNLDSAVMLYEKTSSLAQAYKIPGEAADNLANLADLLSVQGKYTEALTYYREAIQFFSTLKDSASLADMHNGIGSIYEQKAQYPTALGYYLKALKIAQNIKSDLIKSTTYESLGNLYYKQRDWTKSLKNYEDALKLLERYDYYTLQKARVYGEIGSVLIEMNQYDKAIISLKKGLAIAEKFGLAKTISDVTYFMGLAFHKKKDLNQAKSYYQEAYELKKKVQDKYGLIALKLQLGDIYLADGNARQAIIEMEEALSIGKELDAKDGMKLASNKLASVYSNINDFRKAYEYQALVVEIDEEVFSLEKNKAISEVELNHLIKMKEKDLEDAQHKADIKDQKSKAQNQLTWAIGGICVLLFLGILLVIRHNARQRFIQKELQRKNREIAHQNKAISEKNNEIDKQKKLLEDKYEELKELDNEKNYLVGVVAHDLKSPLNQIKGFLTILKYEKDTFSKTTVQTHNMIDQTVDNMSQMISKILDLKAIESKTLNMQIEAQAVNTIVREVLDNLELSAKEKSINLNFHTQTPKDTVALDKKLLEQILSNLISNAIKFSEIGKEVFICTESIGNKLQIRIKDQGPGINQEEQDKLFQKFQKLSAKPTAKESSTGLGLSIVKKYTEAMNGKVWHENAEEGGSIFVVEFPQ